MMRLYAVLIMSLLLFGCGGDPRSEIVGQWQGVSLAQDFTFYADGTVELDDRSHGSYRGVYSIDDEGELRCDFERFSQPVIRGVEISGEEMVLINPKSVDEVYRRIGD